MVGKESEAPGDQANSILALKGILSTSAGQCAVPVQALHGITYMGRGGVIGFRLTRCTGKEWSNICVCRHVSRAYARSPKNVSSFVRS